MVLRLLLACWRWRCQPTALKRSRLPIPRRPRQRSTPAISRRLCIGAVITIIAAGIIIVGTAITAGTIATMDGIAITTITVTGVDDQAYAPVQRLLLLSHLE